MSAREDGCLQGKFNSEFGEAKEKPHNSAKRRPCFPSVMCPGRKAGSSFLGSGF